jgi:hypothetical protein
MRKRTALQALDHNALSEGPRITPRRRNDIDQLTKSEKEMFALKKTPKISNCAVTLKSHRKPPMPLQGRGRKKKSFVTTRRRRTGAASPAFTSEKPELPEADLTPVRREKENTDSSRIPDEETSKEIGNTSIVDIAAAGGSRTPPERIVREASQSANVPHIATLASLESVRRNFKDFSGHGDTKYEGKAKMSSDEEMDCASDTPSGIDESDQSSEGNDEMIDCSSLRSPIAKRNQQALSFDPTVGHMPSTERNKSRTPPVTKSPQTDGRFEATDNGFQAPDHIYNGFQAPDHISISLPKEQIDALRSQPADNENVFRLVLASGTEVNPPYDVPGLVGAVVGGDQLQRSESLDESEITSITLERRMLHEISDQVLQSRARPGPANSASAVKAPTRYDTIKCSVVGDFPLEIGGTVEEWSWDEDDLSSTSSILFRQGDKGYIHPRVPPGWKVVFRDHGEKVIYLRPNQKETPTCPVELPSKAEAKTLRIAKVGKKRGRNAEVFFESNNLVEGHPGLHYVPEQESDTKEEALSSSKAATVHRNCHSGFNHVPQQESDSEDESLQSSVSDLLLRNDPASFRKKPNTRAPHAVKKHPKYDSYLSMLTTDTSFSDTETLSDVSGLQPGALQTPCQAAAVNSRKTEGGAVAPQGQAGRSIDTPDCHKANASFGLHANNSAGLSPVKEEGESMQRNPWLGTVPMSDGGLEKGPSYLAGAMFRTSAPSTREDTVLQQPGISTEARDGVVRSATRRLRGLRLATPVSTNAAIPTPVQRWSTTKPRHSSGEKLPFSIIHSASKTRSFRSGNSLTEKSKRELTPSLKMYKLGLAKRNRDLISSGGEEVPSISPKGVRDGFYEDQTQPSPLCQSAGQDLVEIHQPHHEVAPNTALRAMESSLGHALETIPTTAMATLDGDKAILRTHVEATPSQVTTEKQVHYETVGISTQSRVVKSSSERVLLATPKSTKTQPQSRLAYGKFSSRRKQKHPSIKNNDILGSRNRGYSNDTESVFEDEMSPLAHTETSDSGLRFVEKNADIYRTCSDGQPHATTDGARKEGTKFQKAGCLGDYEARQGHAHEDFADANPKPVQKSTSEDQLFENGRVTSLSHEGIGQKAYPIVEEHCVDTKGKSDSENRCFGKVHEKYPEDEVSPRVLPIKTPKNRDAGNWSQKHENITDVSLEDLDPTTSLPIGGDWESPDCSGIPSCGESDEESPLADVKSVARPGVHESPVTDPALLQHGSCESAKVRAQPATGERFWNPLGPKQRHQHPEFQAKDRKAKSAEPESQEQELKGAKGEGDSVVFRFVDDESSDEEESLNHFDPTQQKEKLDAEYVRDSLRITEDEISVDHNESSDDEERADSIAGSMQSQRESELDVDDSSICSPAPVAHSPSGSDARGRGMGWRVLYPPHPICSLQNLDLLPRRRNGRKPATRPRKAVVPRKKRKMQRGKSRRGGV